MPTLASAASSYYLVTSQSSANTTIDYNTGGGVHGGHEMTWLDSQTSQSCFVVNCATYNSSYFSPNFDWDLAGGLFTIKRGTANDGTTGNNVGITLDLWDVTNGSVTGILGSLTGNNVGTVTVLPADVSTSYTQTLFQFTNAVTLQSGHKYVATLTSLVGDGGNEQYFIKGIDQLSITTSSTGTGGADLVAPGSAPEPSTWFTLAGGLGLALLASRRKSRTV